MRSLILFSLLIPFASAAVAESAPSDSLYGNWCGSQATAEKVPQEERARHIAACVEALEEADRNPDAGKKKKDDEES